MLVGQMGLALVLLTLGAVVASVIQVWDLAEEGTASLALAGAPVSWVLAAAVVASAVQIP